jgi:transcriptional regulator with GAF, ATPase, and Fis domain
MPGFIHSSPAMTRLVEEVHKIRSSDVTVLITGESGTGKELVARAIHALSTRRGKVFIPFNCTAVPKELSEGYLFGYRRGSFTGAVADSPGVIRTAAGGTLFLDEVGDLPLDVQPKLLRFLQEGEIQPLGEQRPQKVDVRIIAATNTDLEGMVADGRFREDLYYRLNVIRLRVPPLRERRSEIPTIVSYYINHYSAKFGRRDIQFTPQTLDLLTVCDWPGNVRQLTNEIQRIVARAEDGTVITPDHISPELRRTSAPEPAAAGSGMLLAQAPGLAAAAATQAISQGLTLADATAELERRMIAEAMRKHNGNISRAARELGLTRRGLYLKLGRHDLTASA